jgi:hypothetical protein
MVKGRLVDQATVSADRSEHHRTVWTYAEQIAQRDHRAVTVNDLRHAAYIYALKKDKSSTEFTNVDLDRILVLFRLLVDPDDLAAVHEWDHPELAVQRRLVWVIEHSAPEAYIRKVAGDKCGTIYWRELPIPSLRQLAMTLRNRTNAWRKPVPKELDAENAPF